MRYAQHMRYDYLIFIIFMMATMAFNELKQKGTTELTEIRLI